MKQKVAFEFLTVKRVTEQTEEQLKYCLHLQNIIEKIQGTILELFTTFIDYSTVYDSVIHQRMV